MHQLSRPSKSNPSLQHMDNSNLTKLNFKHLNTNPTTANVYKSYRKSQTFTPNIVPDPIYYNMSQSTTLFDSPRNSSSSTNLTAHEQNRTESHHGHYNPTYQHSTPNLTSSNPEAVDEIYNNRPPSVRSSYSNFHGTRLLSTNFIDNENVFVGLNTMSSNDVHVHSSRSQPMPISQLPPRQPTSMAFLNNGPPAYNLNYHTPPDSNSETTM